MENPDDVAMYRMYRTYPFGDILCSHRMSRYLLKWLILSVIIVTIGHYLYEFYVMSHSPPKLRDLQNERNSEYEILRKLVPRQTHQDVHPETPQQMYTEMPVQVPVEPSQSPSDKEALKAFMRQIESDSTPI